MSDEPLDPAVLVEQALRGRGNVPLATLLAAFVPVAALRELARQHGLTPKGGYRVDKAPAKVLAPLLGEHQDPRVLDDVCRELVRHLRPPAPDRGAAPESDGAAPHAADAAAPSLEPVLRLKEHELERVRADLERARDMAARQRQKEAELTRRLDSEQERGARLRAELDGLRRQQGSDGSGPGTPLAAAREEARERRELEREVELLAATEHAQRLRLAEQAARVRELEAQVAELEALVPKGRRRKAPPPEPPPLPPRFRLPHFTTQFYKSLIGKERRSVEAALQAVLLFATEGPQYPGLEVKQLEGQSLWSMRAALKLRVYFALRDDGDIDVLYLADREEQHTTLRRLKER